MLDFEDGAISGLLSQFEDGRGIFTRIIEIADGHKCKKVIIEPDFEDKGYSDEYKNYYSKFFKPYEKMTTRVHFFKKYPTENLENDYIGYCILRPIERYRTAETLIKPPTQHTSQTEYPEYFILCATKFPVSFGDKNFSIKAAPFIQRDSQISMCAHTSIWNTTRYMAQRFGYSHSTLYGINQMATQIQSRGRAIPTKGLYTTQMDDALHLMKYSPLLLDRADEEWRGTPSEIIYRYAESELPVIIGTRDHAFTVNGHTFNPSARIQSTPQGYHNSVEWVESFIVHDDGDRQGPYIERSKAEMDQNTETIMVPLPPDVNLRGEGAELYAWKHILRNPTFRNKIKRIANPKTVDLSYQLLGIEEKNTVLRTYLLESDLYKKLAKKSHLHPSVKLTYQKIKMPKYVWIVEVSTTELFPTKRLMCGEIIYDSTQKDINFNQIFLAVHLPNLLIIRDPATESIYINELEDDKEYEHFIRRLE